VENTTYVNFLLKKPKNTFLSSTTLHEKNDKKIILNINKSPITTYFASHQPVIQSAIKARRYLPLDMADFSHQRSIKIKTKLFYVLYYVSFLCLLDGCSLCV
jgi:hypothetical protein